MRVQRKRRKHQVLFDHFAVVESLQQSIREDFQSQHLSGKEGELFKREQVKQLMKKYPPASREGSDERSEAAKKKFLSTLSHLQKFSSRIYPGNVSRAELNKLSVSDLTLIRARSIMHQILGHFSSEEWFDECKHGPGSTLGVGHLDTGFSAKFVPPWTATQGAASLFVEYLHYDNTLFRFFERAAFVTRPESIWANVQLVESSRLTTVPKNDKTDRTIAVEPTLNMFFQQGLNTMMSRRLSHFGVDIQVQQQVHRDMALEASITRKYATIDFSSASDCVEIGLLKFLLPPIWFWAVDKCRCESVTVDDVTYPLPCIATMGNATTFVLETLVFFVLGLSTVMQKYTTKTVFPEWEDFKSLSVYGDDCIVPSEDAQSFMDLCRTVGFIVNDEKSHFEISDPFRESCGADFISGYNVRPFYPKGPRSTKPSVLRAWLYTTWNTSLKMLTMSVGRLNAPYTQTLQLLAELICRHNKDVFLVDDRDPEDAGIKINGDSRFLKLFPAGSLSPGYQDGNGTLRYKSLRSAPPARGILFQELEIWMWLKFPKKIDILSPSRQVDYLSKKVDRGYVVGWSSSFSEDLMEIFKLI